VAAKSPKDGPIIVKAGSVRVKIYTVERSRTWGTFTEATVVWYELDGRRCRKVCSSLEDAKKEAGSIAARLSRGTAATDALSGTDLEKYRHAVAHLAPTGVPLQVAIEEYVKARALLPAGMNLLSLVEEHVRRMPTAAPTVGEVVAEMIAEKRRASLSKFHVADLNKRLTPFAAAMQTRISSLSASVVRPYLEGLKKADNDLVAPRTRLNTLRAICGLLHFARKRRYVNRELVDEVSEIDLPRARGGVIGVFTPDQIQRILAAVNPDLVPCIAIGAFAGLRSTELSRLLWTDVKLKEGVIVVGAEAAKTATRRVVPIQPNLAAWLERYGKTEGRVSPVLNENSLWNRFQGDAAKRSGVTWVKNGLRHSFVSYRLAVTHDPSRVATEAGNSPAMVHRHYKALCTEAEGKEWFAIMPSEPMSSPAAQR
jgi:integrase